MVVLRREVGSLWGRRLGAASGMCVRTEGPGAEAKGAGGRGGMASPRAPGCGDPVFHNLPGGLGHSPWPPPSSARQAPSLSASSCHPHSPQWWLLGSTRGRPAGVGRESPESQGDYVRPGQARRAGTGLGLVDARSVMGPGEERVGGGGAQALGLQTGRTARAGVPGKAKGLGTQDPTLGCLPLGFC